MSKQSFTDPVTGAMLHAFGEGDEIPEARLFFGRKLGYTDDQIKSMWLQDARRPRYVDVSQLDRVMTKGEAEWLEARNR